EAGVRGQGAGFAADLDALDLGLADSLVERHVGAEPPAAVHHLAIAADHSVLAVLDVFDLDMRAGRAVGQALAGVAVDANEMPARGRWPARRPLAGHRRLHEFGEDRCAERAAEGRRTE